MASDMEVPFLGKLPLDPRIGRCCDEGKSFLTEVPDSPAADAYKKIIQSTLLSCTRLLLFFFNFKLNCTESYVSLRRQTYFRSSLLSSSKVKKRQPEIQLNLFITVALGLEENGLCREVTVVERLKQESMYGRYAKKWPLQRGGRCGEVAVVERWPLWRGGCCGEVAAVERWPL